MRVKRKAKFEDEPIQLSGFRVRVENVLFAETYIFSVICVTSPRSECETRYSDVQTFLSILEVNFVRFSCSISFLDGSLPLEDHKAIISMLMKGPPDAILDFSNSVILRKLL